MSTICPVLTAHLFQAIYDYSRVILPRNFFESQGVLAGCMRQVPLYSMCCVCHFVCLLLFSFIACLLSEYMSGAGPLSELVSPTSSL